jgi:hypothetical protein
VDSLPVWTVPPNWASAVLERLEWLTDVFPSRTRAEQRRQLRLSPRRSFEFDLLRYGPQRTYLDLFIRENAAKLMYLPVWHDGTALASVADPGDDVIACDTRFREFADDGYVLIMNKDCRIFERAQIDSFTDSTITFVDELSSGWPKGTRVYPLKKAILEEAPKLTRHSRTVIDATVRFILDGPQDHDDDIDLPAYRGRPVLTFAPNERDTGSLEYGLELEELDNETGALTRVDATGRAFLTQTFLWFLKGREKHAEFRTLLYSLAGKAKSIWLPSQMDDLTMVANRASGDTYITIERVGMVDFGIQPDRQDIQIELKSGTILRRRINSVAAISSTVERLNLDSALGVEVTSAGVRRISFLSIVRLDQDAIEINHVTDQDGVSESTTVFVSFPDTRNEVTDNFVAIPETAMDEGGCGECDPAPPCVAWIAPTPDGVLDFVGGSYALLGTDFEAADFLDDTTAITSGSGFEISNSAAVAKFLPGDIFDYLMSMNWTMVIDVQLESDNPQSFQAGLMRWFKTQEGSDWWDNPYLILPLYGLQDDSWPERTATLVWDMEEYSNDFYQDLLFMANRSNPFGPGFAQGPTGGKIVYTRSSEYGAVTGRGQFVSDDNQNYNEAGPEGVTDIQLGGSYRPNDSANFMRYVFYPEPQVQSGDFGPFDDAYLFRPNDGMLALKEFNFTNVIGGTWTFDYDFTWDSITLRQHIGPDPAFGFPEGEPVGGGENLGVRQTLTGATPSWYTVDPDTDPIEDVNTSSDPADAVTPPDPYSVTDVTTGPPISAHKTDADQYTVYTSSDGSGYTTFDPPPRPHPVFMPGGLLSAPLDFTMGFYRNHDIGLDEASALPYPGNYMAHEIAGLRGSFSVEYTPPTGGGQVLDPDAKIWIKSIKLYPPQGIYDMQKMGAATVTGRPSWVPRLAAPGCDYAFLALDFPGDRYWNGEATSARDNVVEAYGPETIEDDYLEADGLKLPTATGIQYNFGQISKTTNALLTTNFTILQTVKLPGSGKIDVWLIDINNGWEDLVIRIYDDGDDSITVLCTEGARSVTATIARPAVLKAALTRTIDRFELSVNGGDAVVDLTASDEMFAVSSKSISFGYPDGSIDGAPMQNVHLQTVALFPPQAIEDLPGVTA